MDLDTPVKRENSGLDGRILHSSNHNSRTGSPPSAFAVAAPSRYRSSSENADEDDISITGSYRGYGMNTQNKILTIKRLVGFFDRQWCFLRWLSLIFIGRVQIYYRCDKRMVRRFGRKRSCRIPPS